MTAQGRAGRVLAAWDRRHAGVDGLPARREVRAALVELADMLGAPGKLDVAVRHLTDVGPVAASSRLQAFADHLAAGGVDPDDRVESLRRLLLGACAQRQALRVCGRCRR